MRKFLVVIAVMALMLTPLAANAQASDELLAALDDLGTAVDDFGTALDGGDFVEIAVAYEAVTAAFTALDAADADGALDTSGFVAAWEALGAAIEAEDIDAAGAAYGDLQAAYADLVDQAAALQPTTTTTAGETTTTAAPEGGVDTGAGGTADSTTFPIGILGAAGAMSLLLAGLYALRRRTDS
jgi:hypothetical protein